MNLCQGSNVHINDLMKINSVKVSDWTFKNIKNLNWDDHLESFGNIEDALNSKLYTLCIKEGSHTWTLILTKSNIYGNTHKTYDYLNRLQYLYIFLL